MIRQNADGDGLEWLRGVRLPVRATQSINLLSQQITLTIRQIYREEIRGTTEIAASISRHARDCSAWARYALPTLRLLPRIALRFIWAKLATSLD